MYLLALKRAYLVVFIYDEQLYGQILGFSSKQIDGFNKYCQLHKSEAPYYIADNKVRTFYRDCMTASSRGRF